MNVLLEFAKNLSISRFPALGIAMIRVSRLEKRISSMMPIERYSPGKTVRLASLLTALVITTAVGVTTLAESSELAFREEKGITHESLDELTSSPEPGKNPCVTDEEGRWKLDNVPEGDEVIIRVKLTHPKYISDKQWGGLQTEQLINTKSFRDKSAVLVMHRKVVETLSVNELDGQKISEVRISRGDERRGELAVRKAGGSVRFNYQFSADGKFHADAAPPETDIAQNSDEYEIHIVEIKANTKPFTDRDLAQLKGLKELRSLQIFETDITDKGLKSLKKLKRLEVIDLRNTQVTDIGLTTLGKLTNLKKLLLGGTKITNEGLVHLQKLHDLQVLFLDYTSIDDAGLAHLSGLRNLKELHLSGTKVTDEGLLHIKGMAHLNDLLLSNTAITDSGLLHLRDLDELKFISLVGTDVSEASISELKKAPNNHANKSIGAKSSSDPSGIDVDQTPSCIGEKTDARHGFSKYAG